MENVGNANDFLKTTTEKSSELITADDSTALREANVVSVKTAENHESDVVTDSAAVDSPVPENVQEPPTINTRKRQSARLNARRTDTNSSPTVTPPVKRTRKAVTVEKTEIETVSATSITTETTTTTTTAIVAAEILPPVAIIAETTSVTTETSTSEVVTTETSTAASVTSITELSPVTPIAVPPSSTVATATATTTESPALRRSQRQLSNRSRYPDGEWISTTGRLSYAKTVVLVESAKDGDTPSAPAKQRGRQKKTTNGSSEAVSELNSTTQNASEIDNLIAAVVSETISTTVVSASPKKRGRKIKSAVTIKDLPTEAPVAVDDQLTIDIKQDNQDEEDLPLAKVVQIKSSKPLGKSPKKSPKKLASPRRILIKPVEDDETETHRQSAARDANGTRQDCLSSPTFSDEADDSVQINDKRRDSVLSKNDTSLENDGQEDMLYPCTICRQSASAKQLIKCRNCPRYYHASCVKTDESENGGKRQFCPKCARTMPILALSDRFSLMKKKRHSKTLSGASMKKSRKVEKLPPATTKSSVSCAVCNADVSDSDSVYCSDACLHSMVKKVSRLTKADAEFVAVINRQSGTALKKDECPSVSGFASWLLEHRSCVPVLTSQSSTDSDSAAGSVCSDAKPKSNEKRPKSLTKPRHSMPAAIGSETRRESDERRGSLDRTSSTAEKQAQCAVDHNRLSIRKALRDVLILRAKDADDVLLTNDEIKQLAVDLEQEIFKAHKDDNSSYKQQCKNLVTNLRNLSNKGLFRRLLSGDLKIRRAATMSNQEMASREYSYWAAAEEEEDKAAESARLKMAYMESSKLFSKSRAASEADGVCDIFGLLHNDTTTEHKSHLFDLNCKICTGKQRDDEPAVVTIKKERKESVSVKPAVLTYRPELGEKLIKREDGKLDIVVPVPHSRQSDPLHLENTMRSSADTNSPPSTSCQISSVESRRKSSVKFSISGDNDDTIDSEVSPTERSELTSNEGSSSKTSPETPESQTKSRFPLPASMVPSFWHGLLDMPQWFKFQTSFKLVSGPSHLLKRDLPPKLEIVGRIPPTVVYEYLVQIRKAGGKDFVVFRLPEPPLDEDRTQWEGLFSNMTQKQRFCVIDNKAMPMIKDFYLVPLGAEEEPNGALLPFQDGPGLEMPRKNCILGVIVRHRERPVDTSAKTSTSVASPPEKSYSLSSIGSSASSTPVASDGTPLQDSQLSPPTTTASLSESDLKIIKFVGDRKSNDERKETSNDATIVAQSMQPHLKKLLDEIGQVENPAELASKLLNCLNKTTSQPASEQTVVKPTGASRNSDPRQKATPMSQKPVEKLPEENKPKESEQKWTSWMKSDVTNCMPQDQPESKDDSEKSVAVTSAVTQSNDSPASTSVASSSTVDAPATVLSQNPVASAWRPPPSGFAPFPAPFPGGFAAIPYGAPPPYYGAPPTAMVYPPAPYGSTAMPPPIYGTPVLVPPPPPPPMLAPVKTAPLEEGELNDDDDEEESGEEKSDDEEGRRSYKSEARKSSINQTDSEQHRSNNKKLLQPPGRRFQSRWDRMQPMDRGSWKSVAPTNDHSAITNQISTSSIINPQVATGSVGKTDTNSDSGGSYQQLNPIVDISLQTSGRSGSGDSRSLNEQRKFWK